MMNKKNIQSYKLIIAYDGSSYYGWQSQIEKPSIAHALDHAFKKIFKSDVRILGHHVLMRVFTQWDKLPV